MPLEHQPPRWAGIRIPRELPALNNTGDHDLVIYLRRQAPTQVLPQAHGRRDPTGHQSPSDAPTPPGHSSTTRYGDHQKDGCAIDLQPRTVARGPQSHTLGNAKRYQVLVPRLRITWHIARLVATNSGQCRHLSPTLSVYIHVPALTGHSCANASPHTSSAGTRTHRHKADSRQITRFAGQQQQPIMWKNINSAMTLLKLTLQTARHPARLANWSPTQRRSQQPRKAIAFHGQRHTTHITILIGATARRTSGVAVFVVLAARTG